MKIEASLFVGCLRLDVSKSCVFDAPGQKLIEKAIFIYIQSFCITHKAECRIYPSCPPSLKNAASSSVILTAFAYKILRTKPVCAKACHVMPRPASVMAKALMTGATENANRRMGKRANTFSWLRCSNQRRAYTIAKPMAVRVAARPRLNEITSNKPNPMRCNAIAPSMTTNADGHGSNPPEMPNINKLRHVTASPLLPGGAWLCICPSP